MTNGETSPILQVTSSFQRWRRIRPFVFGGVAVLVVATAAFLVHSAVVARRIRSDLSRAAELSSTDTIDAQAEALDLLERLWQRHPGHEGVRARYAWQHVLMALRLGPAEPHVEAARRALGEAAGASEPALMAAARAGVLLVGGDAAGAEALARATRQQAPTCRECTFIHALAVAALGHGAEAVPILDQARQGRPPFLPALASLAELLQSLGRYSEAEAALHLVLQAAPGHQGAKAQAVLLRLDQAAADPEAGAKLVAPLRAELAGVSIDDAYPRQVVFKHYAGGRLSLLEGDLASAIDSLSKAAKARSDDQTLATWLAIAERKAGRHLDAIEALSAFPDAPSSDLGLLTTRAEILLDLHRTTDAAASIAVLVQRNVKVAPLLEGRRLLAAGEPDEALVPLKAALAQGYVEAALAIAEAQLLRGRANEANDLLREVTAPAVQQGCVDGMRDFLQGRTAEARRELAKAASAGSRCGNALAGLLLLGTGQDREQVDGLVKALAEREDLRDRVALGRTRFRVEGVEKARVELDRVRAAEPQGAVVLEELALAYEELGLREVAREVATEGVARTKGHPLLISAAADLARKAGRLDDAEAVVADGLKARPKSGQLLLERAANLFARRQYTEAEELVSQVIAPGPTFATAACLRARVQERRGNQRDAQQDLARAASRAVTRSGAAEEAKTRACIVEHFMRLGRPSYGKARANLFLLRQLAPGFTWAEIPALAGQLAALEGEREDAAQSYRRALALDAANRRSWAGLAELDALTAEDREIFGRMWPGVEPGASEQAEE
jgi:tetratricopeptide (TPR) repeat protein